MPKVFLIRKNAHLDRRPTLLAERPKVPPVAATSATSASPVVPVVVTTNSNQHAQQKRATDGGASSILFGSSAPYRDGSASAFDVFVGSGSKTAASVVSAPVIYTSVGPPSSPTSTATDGGKYSTPGGHHHHLHYPAVSSSPGQTLLDNNRCLCCCGGTVSHAPCAAINFATGQPTPPCSPNENKHFNRHAPGNQDPKAGMTTRTASSALTKNAPQPLPGPVVVPSGSIDIPTKKRKSHSAGTKHGTTVLNLQKSNVAVSLPLQITDGRSRKKQRHGNSSGDGAAADATPEQDDGELAVTDGGAMKTARYTCGDCGKSYATSSNLSRHKQTHRSMDSGNAKKCLTCGKTYVSMPALSMHLLTHKLTHECGICKKKFSRPWLLQGHLRSHTGEKPFTCQSHGCGKSFADRSNLRAHMQTHGSSRQFMCDACGKTFSLKSYLNKHLESSCLVYRDGDSSSHGGGSGDRGDSLCRETGSESSSMGDASMSS
ncbi:Transcriptional repressor scratch 1 [Hypsibius exemplaris]|uniref:Transcriptional repressor scratch 1 n=1 Tax=Hypsibius exemplaris TaxID=2072580 RepID=A0A9X6NBQ9_HYPEX|nr:Transcriptional repressor scratch 1 [Hypsibius exemplaris]